MVEQASKPQAPPHFEIFVDGKKFSVESPTLTGAQIKQLAERPANYQLFLEQPGHPDQQINDGEIVKLKSADRFHTVPPAQFG